MEQAVGIRDPAGAWTGWLRKARTLALVARRWGGTPTPGDYERRVRDLARKAALASTLTRRIWILWRIEGLTFACADRFDESFRLGELSLPLEAGPPAACGLSMAVVLGAGFDPEGVVPILEDRADPRFVDFAFESVGLMLAAYEPDLFGRLTGALGRLRLMRRPRLGRPDPEACLDGLPTRWRTYAAHGFGRLAYFKSHGLGGAVRSLARRPYLSFAAAVKGAIAAYVLVNGSRLARVLALADDGADPAIEAAVRDGLYNVVKLLAWSLPGCLDGVTAPGQRSGALLAAAVEEARELRARELGPGLVP